MKTQPNEINSFFNACKNHGLKITPQRTIIFEEISKAKNHPSANEIYTHIKFRLPNISFDTVYRTLMSFSQIGIINLVEGYGETMRFEPDLHYHHHCRCLKCHTIIDCYDDLLKDISLPKNLENKFRVTNKRIVFEGICKSCMER